MATEQKCENCRFFWERSLYPEGYGPEPGSTGVCRRYPPRAMREYEEEQDQTFEINSALPSTYRTQWCGEYAPANPETVTEGGATLARLVLLGDLTAARALADQLRE